MLIIKNGRIITPFRILEEEFIAIEKGSIVELSQKSFSVTETDAKEQI